MMRKAFDPQRRLDCPSIPNVRLNLNCRTEIIPILRALGSVCGRQTVCFLPGIGHAVVIRIYW